MKRYFLCMSFAVIMCLGCVGCNEEGGGARPAETEKTTQQVEETISPMEILPDPAERQPQGEQEGDGDVSHNN